jgi:hypothetical protein
MPRFVVLEHDHPFLHWDLLLEVGSHLRAWRLAGPPEPGKVIPATANFLHRLLYLDYEGPVSGGRGTVRRSDAGTFSWLADEPDLVRVKLAGRRLLGDLVLTRLEDENWSVVLTE